MCYFQKLDRFYLYRAFNDVICHKAALQEYSINIQNRKLIKSTEQAKGNDGKLNLSETFLERNLET